MDHSREHAFRARLLATFKLEAEEHLQAISSSLLSIEKGGDDDLFRTEVETISRELHSLKGASRAVGNQSIELACQVMEDIFSRLKQGRPGMLDKEAFNILHSTMDFLRSVSGDPNAQPAGDPEWASNPLQKLRGIKLVEEPGLREEKTFQNTVSNSPAKNENPTGPAASGSQDTVRVKTNKLDAILHQSEELILLKQMMLHHSGQLSELRTWLDQLSILLNRKIAVSGPLDDQAMNALKEDLMLVKKTRGKLDAVQSKFSGESREASQVINRLVADARGLIMMPVTSLLESFPKMVRDLSMEQGKEVEWLVSGAELEVDRRILELLKDPMIHMVRNCLDHGIELPEERIRQGKEKAGKIQVNISTATGNQLEIRISDDGRGIDMEELSKIAVNKGFVSAGDLETMNSVEKMELVYLSGLSTTRILSEISGRGLGMSIIREKVEQAGGTVSIVSTIGKGTRLKIRLPLSFGTYRGIRIREGSREFVVPTRYVESVSPLDPHAVKTVGGRRIIQFQGDSISLERLGLILETEQQVDPDQTGSLRVLFLNSGGRRLGLEVDAILNEEEILVKTFPPPLENIRHFEGVTILGSGQPVLILSVHDLLRSVANGKSRVPVLTDQEYSGKEKPSIVVAEDSMTARMLLKDILESAGYQVSTAVDGAEALDILQHGHYDLLVSDIEMPRLDGFELTRTIRQDQSLSELPVILVTSLKTREDRERGMEAGANAYIEKGSFDPEQLLQIISQLTP